MKAKVRDAFQSLKVPNYRLFVTGQLIKLLGVWCLFVAQDWLVLDLSHNSATALGIVTAFQFAPVVLLTLYGGKLADLYDRRAILVAANAMYAALAAVFGVLVYIHVINLATVFVFAALMGTVNAIEQPVRQAFVSDLVEPGLLGNALGLSSATFNLSRIAGPALAGVAIWLIGIGPVFLSTAVFCIAPVIMLMRIDPRRLHSADAEKAKTVPAEAPSTVRARLSAAFGAQPRDGAHSPEESPEARIRDGIAYVWRRDDLLLPLTLLLVVGMCGFNFQLTLSVLAKKVFGTGAQSFGLLTTALAIGALAGALYSGARRHRPSAYLVVGSGVVFGLLETLSGLAPTFWSTAALLVPTGFFMICFAQATNQRIQLGLSPEFRGRVMALFVLVFVGTTPVGGPLVGFVSQHLGPRVGVWGGGLVSLLASLVALVWQLRRDGVWKEGTLPNLQRL